MGQSPTLGNLTPIFSGLYQKKKDINNDYYDNDNNNKEEEGARNNQPLFLNLSYSFKMTWSLH